MDLQGSGGRGRGRDHGTEGQPVSRLFAGFQLTNLVPGRYVFRLTVTDDQGLSDYDVATLLVRADPRRLDAVTLTLASDAAAFTEGELTTLRDQIRLLLHQPGSVDVSVHMDDVVVDPRSGHPVLQFYTSVKTADGAWRHLPAPQGTTHLPRSFFLLFLFVSFFVFVSFDST